MRNFDDLHRCLVSTVYRHPDHECSPRGMKIRESLPMSFTLEDPRARTLSSPARAANYGFAAGEFMWYLRGASDLESIAYYNKRMVDFSDDGETLNSAYGARLFGGQFLDGRDAQWDDAKATLLADPDSRRAVMAIYRAEDGRRAVGSGSKDVPCTMAMQFFIRDSGAGPRLHMHVTMRSNDLIWGLANDLFSFTLLQEVMLLDLREAGMATLELGAYHHTAGSLHVYERHFNMCEEILREPETRAEPMPPLTSRDALASLQVDETALRRAGYRWSKRLYTGGEQWLLDQLVAHRAKRLEEAARVAEAKQK